MVPHSSYMPKFGFDGKREQMKILLNKNCIIIIIIIISKNNVHHRKVDIYVGIIMIFRLPWLKMILSNFCNKLNLDGMFSRAE